MCLTASYFSQFLSRYLADLHNAFNFKYIFNVSLFYNRYFSFLKWRIFSFRKRKVVVLDRLSVPMAKGCN